MSIAVSDVMRHVRNHFVTGYADFTWKTIDGPVQPELGLTPGTWIAITGADAISGVYQIDEHGAISGIPDGQWTGRIWFLSPPAAFLRLCREIDDWVKAHPDPTLVSEKFGAYSRSQSSAAWQRVFASALSPYMRMYPEVTL